MGYSTTIKDRVRIAVALMVVQTKSSEIDIETHLLNLRVHFQPPNHSNDQPPLPTTDNNNLNLLSKHNNKLSNQISTLKRKLVITELKLMNSEEQVKAAAAAAPPPPPNKKKKITHPINSNVPNTLISKKPTTTSSSTFLASPSPSSSSHLLNAKLGSKSINDDANTNAVPASSTKKRKPRTKPIATIENSNSNSNENENEETVLKMDMSSIPVGFTHAEAAVMLFGQPGDRQDYDHHILASLLDLPKILRCTADQISVLVSYAKRIIEACGDYIADAIVSQRPGTSKPCHIPPILLISNISEILCRFLPRFLRNLEDNKREDVVSELLVDIQDKIVERCIKWFYPLSLWDSRRIAEEGIPIETRSRIGAQDVALALVQFLQRLVDSTSRSINGVTYNPMNTAIAEIVAARGLAEIIQLRDLESKRIQEREVELQSMLITSNIETRKFLLPNPISTEMYKRRQASIASDQAQHYLITLLEHALPHLPIIQDNLRISSSRRNNNISHQDALIFSIRSMLLRWFLESNIIQEISEDRDNAVSQRLTGLGEKLSLAEDEEREAVQRAIDIAARIAENVKMLREG